MDLGLDVFELSQFWLKSIEKGHCVEVDVLALGVADADVAVGTRLDLFFEVGVLANELCLLLL